MDFRESEFVASGQNEFQGGTATTDFGNCNGAHISLSIVMVNVQSISSTPIVFIYQMMSKILEILDILSDPTDFPVQATQSFASVIHSINSLPELVFEDLQALMQIL